jgi:hypothetical protein
MVMIVIPTVLNTVQFWVTDSFLKVSGDTPPGDETLLLEISPSHFSSSSSSSSSSGDGGSNHDLDEDLISNVSSFLQFYLFLYIYFYLFV